MSSTNRGYDRHKSDFYVTPPECVKEFLGAWFSDLANEPDYNFVCDRPDRVLWLDPCAGGDEKHEMTYPAVLMKEFGAFVKTIDVREDSRAETKGDYLTMEKLPYTPDVVITNPPFYLATEIIEKALADVADNGYVVMLLRLNFFGSKARFNFFENNPPKWAYVHHRRMSFTDDGKTDSIEYMHAVWQKNYTAPYTNLKVI